MNAFFLLLNNLKFQDLMISTKISIVFFILAVMLSFIFFSKKLSTKITCEELILDYSEKKGIKTNGIEKSYLVISPFVSIKNNKQIIPFYLSNKMKIYYLIEAIWWVEYTKLKLNQDSLSKATIVFLRFMSGLTILGVSYTVILWLLGIEQFQNPEFLWVTIFMMLWSIGFALIPTAYLYDNVVSYLQETKLLNTKDKSKIKRFIKFFWFWQFASLLFEIIITYKRINHYLFKNKKPKK